jgi:hypothetical protein
MSRKLIGEVQIDFTKILSDYNNNIIKQLDNITKDKTVSVPLIDIYDLNHITLKENGSGSVANININNIDNMQIVSFDVNYNFMNLLNDNIDNISIANGTINITDHLCSTTMYQTLDDLKIIDYKEFPYTVEELNRTTPKLRYLKTYEKTIRSFTCGRKTECGYVSHINAVLKYSNVTRKINVVIVITSKRLPTKDNEETLSIKDQLVTTLKDLTFRIVTEEK